jgi:phage host-nuclease inhibitor protein Gam
MKSKLDDWNDDLDRMKAGMDDTKASAKKRYDKQIEALREKRQEAEQKLEAIKAGTEDSWVDLKDEVERFWTAFKDSATQFKSHYEKEKGPNRAHRI